MPRNPKHGRKKRVPRRQRAKARPLPTRTKIVATLGPASHDLDCIRALMRAGADVFRLNFSHGSQEEHAQTIRWIRRAISSEKLPIAILADLQGPKIRVSSFKNSEPFYLKPGELLRIVAEEGVLGEPGSIGCTYLELPKDVKKGERILLDDGNIELRVEAISGTEVLTRVRFGGLLQEHKGINLPGTKINAPCLTEKDLFDLEFALAHDIDFVALSFVREADDVLKLRSHIERFGSEVSIVAKIERPEAVENFESILRVTDAVMIARGDMGVELGPEAVPIIQKHIIKRCIEVAKPVITATQMLESMVQKPRPTRAEASDVANAIIDGSSALMLSAESASGKHPVLAVKTMDRIARRIESEIFGPGKDPFRRRCDLRRPPGGAALSISEGTVSAAARAALEVDAKALVVFTETGKTANLVTRERLPTRILALTPQKKTYSRLCLQWGVIPLMTKKARSAAQMQTDGEALILEQGHVRRGDRVVFIAGSMQVSGATNMVTIREVGSEVDSKS